mmetsp:Transcript_27348/g.47580  ORF Transcript_27348/g.47580 Transcript_27348/m.47580 type:complete len:131 (+) Transcript_27348:82-474(+)
MSTLKDQVGAAADAAENKKTGLRGMLLGVQSVLKRTMDGGKRISKMAGAHFYWVMAKGGRISWVLLTATILTMVPLYCEVLREKMVEQQEKIIVADMKKQGYTDAELQRMGYSAMEPSVGLGSDSPASAP